MDTRNNYEVNIGTFKNAKNLNILKFDEFADKIDQLKKIEGEVVMFCTGGIRCEKALGYLNEKGSPLKLVKFLLHFSLKNLVQLQSNIDNFLLNKN